MIESAAPDGRTGTSIRDDAPAFGFTSASSRVQDTIASSRGTPDDAPGIDGFTLVEMLVTLTILSIAVTIGSRSIAGLSSDRRPDQVAATIAAEIGRLRAEALRSGGVERLVFEPEALRFLSSRAGAAPIAAAAVQVRVETPPSPRAVQGEIRILPDGSATGGRIVLVGRTTSTVLSVSALTGRVRREEAR